MTSEKYVPEDNKWIEVPDIDHQKFRSDVYEEVGSTFPFIFKSDDTIVIESEKLPDSISLKEAKKAVKNNHPYNK